MLSRVQNRVTQNQTRGRGQAFSIGREAIPVLAIPLYDENGYVRGFIKGGCLQCILQFSKAKLQLGFAPRARALGSWRF